MSARTTVKSIQDIMRKDVGVDGDAQRLSQLCWMFFLKIIDDQDLKLEVMEEGYSSPIPTHLQWRSGVPWSGVTQGDQPRRNRADGSPPSDISCGNGWAGL